MANLDWNWCKARAGWTCMRLIKRAGSWGGRQIGSLLSVNLDESETVKGSSKKNCCTEKDLSGNCTQVKDPMAWSAAMCPIKASTDQRIMYWKPEGLHYTVPLRSREPQEEPEGNFKLNNFPIRRKVIQIKPHSRKDDPPWKSLYGCRYLSNTEGVLQWFRQLVPWSDSIERMCFYEVTS